MKGTRHQSSRRKETRRVHCKTQSVSYVNHLETEEPSAFQTRPMINSAVGCGPPPSAHRRKLLVCPLRPYSRPRPLPAPLGTFFLPTMRISTLPVLSLVLCVSAALQPFLALRVPAISAASVGHEPTRRQVSIASPSPLPSQCTSTCSPVNDEVSLVSVRSLLPASELQSHGSFSPRLIPFSSITATELEAFFLGMPPHGMLHHHL